MPLGMVSDIRVCARTTRLFVCPRTGLDGQAAHVCARVDTGSWRESRCYARKRVGLSSVGSLEMQAFFVLFTITMRLVSRPFVAAMLAETPTPFPPRHLPLTALPTPLLH